MLRASTRDVLPEGFLSVYEQSKPKVLESMSLELSSFRDGLGAGSSGFQLSNPVQEPRMEQSRSGREELPRVHGQEQQLRFAGAAVKRYPKPKVRET